MPHFITILLAQLSKTPTVQSAVAGLEKAMATLKKAEDQHNSERLALLDHIERLEALHDQHAFDAGRAARISARLGELLA